MILMITKIQKFKENPADTHSETNKQANKKPSCLTSKVGSSSPALVPQSSRSCLQLRKGRSSSTESYGQQ